MRIYVNAPAGASVTITDSNGADYACSIQSDEYGTYAGIRNIPATRFGDTFTVTVTADRGSATAEYSVLGWCIDALKDEMADSQTKDVAKAAYMYYAWTRGYVSHKDADETNDYTPGPTEPCTHKRSHFEKSAIICSDCGAKVSATSRLGLDIENVELVAGVPTDVTFTLSIAGEVDLSVLAVTFKSDNEGVTIVYNGESPDFGDGNIQGYVGANLEIDSSTGIKEACTLVTVTYTVTAAESGSYRIIPVIRGALDSNGEDVADTLISSCAGITAKSAE